MLGYVYAVLWAVIAIYLFSVGIKINKILFLGAGLFTFMSVWWLVNELIDINLFEGIYGIVFRVVVGIVLALFIIFYVISKKKSQNK